jgi:hypothetical protein
MAEPTDDEDEKDRTERQLIELLNELRVVIPGVQVLFAFLLTIPFNQRFGQVDRFQQTVYFVTLLLTALASALFMAPSAYHRLLFHRRDRRHIIEISNRLAIAGLAVLSLAMTGVVLLVTDFLYSSEALVIATTGIVFLVFVVLWGVMPLMRRRALKRRGA